MASTSLRETKDGRKYYFIQVGRGKHVSALTMRWYVPEGWSKKSIERELAKVASDFENRCHAGDVLSRADEKKLEAEKAAEEAQIVTFKQYAEKVYMPALMVTCSEHTRSNTIGQLKAHVYPVIGDMKLPDITTAQLSALLLAFQNSGKALGSVQRLYTILRLIFKKAYQEESIEKNPMDRVAKPKMRKDEIKNTEPDHFDAEELRYIIQCLENEPLKWKALIRLMIVTGARRGELLGLKWKSVNFKKNTITIENNLCYSPAKGIFDDTPKTSTIRTNTIPADVMDLLKRLLNEQRDFIKNVYANAEINPMPQYVFTQDNSLAPMHPDSPTRYLQKFGKRYGIHNIHPHKFRHSFCTLAISAGAAVNAVSARVGHSNPSTTMRMYTGHDADAERRASDTFLNALENGLEGISASSAEFGK